MEQTVQFKDLLPGDILLFSYVPDDWESRLIAILSQSDVSHAAMIYQPTNQIIEEIPEFARLNDLKQRVTGRTISVMRLENKDASLTKVLEIAKGYADEQLPYAMDVLPFVAVYLLVQDLAPSLKWQNIIVKLAKLGIEVLIGLLYRKELPNKLPMVCSQYVYHCYKQAGPEYAICLEKTQKNSLLKLLATYINDHRNTLEEKLLNQPLEQSTLGTQVDSKENIYGEMYEAIEMQMNEVHDSSICDEKELFSQEFIETCYGFCKAFHQVLVHHEIVKLEEQDTFLTPLETLDAISEYFVTPGDLKSHTTNLKFLGILDKSTL